MSLVLFFACFFAVPARAFAMRVAAKGAQEVPWRNSIMVGALLGRAHRDSVVFGLPERDFGRAGAVADGDVYDQLQASLTDSIGGGSNAHEAAFGKLIDSLRSSKRVDEIFVQTLEARVTSKMLQHRKAGYGVEQFLAPSTGDAPGVAIVRYPSQDHFSSKWVDGMQRLLRGIELSRTQDGIFLPFIAQSHTAEEFGLDTKAEVLLMSELSLGSLADVLEAAKPDFDELLRIFVDILGIVQRLNQLGMPHRSDLTLDTVILLPASSESQDREVVLSPEILLVKSEFSGEEVRRADMRQLGTLLRSLFSAEFEATQQPLIDVFLAFGKGMESGAFSGEGSVAAEIDSLLHHLSPGMPQEDLVRLRLQYLRLAVEAEMAEQHEGNEQAAA